MYKAHCITKTFNALFTPVESKQECLIRNSLKLSKPHAKSMSSLKVKVKVEHLL